MWRELRIGAATNRAKLALLQFYKTLPKKIVANLVHARLRDPSIAIARIKLLRRVYKDHFALSRLQSKGQIAPAS